MVKTHHAPGINDWTLFRQSLIAELPHDWHDREDTSLRLAHFVRRHIGAGAENQVKKPPITDSKDKSSVKRRTGSLLLGEGGRFTGIETPPLSKTATLPHDASEHMEHPNVLVAHTSKGLEVISIRTGAPITSLALSTGNSYADIDGDGIVDTLLVLERPEDVSAHGNAFAHDAGELQHCTLMVLSGLPPRAQLFNGTVCHNRNSLTDPTSRHSDFTGRIPAVVAAASPLIMRVIDSKTLLESKVRNVVIALNTGVTTCYSGKGDFKWQIRNTPMWNLDFKFGSTLLFDSDANRMHDSGTHDSIHAQILISGENYFSLLSRDGELQATAEVPKIPISKPIIGDFDSDGVTDVIIITNDAILGYRLEVTASTRSMLIAVVILTVLALIVFVANIRTDSTSGSNTITKINKKNILSIIRSTDDYHID